MLQANQRSLWPQLVNKLFFVSYIKQFTFKFTFTSTNKFSPLITVRRANKMLSLTKLMRTETQFVPGLSYCNIG